MRKVILKLTIKSILEKNLKKMDAQENRQMIF